MYESLAEIYSIVVTLDGLEKAYIKDVVTEAEYTETCTRLLKQYKSSLGDEAVSREFVDLETFKRTWGVSIDSRPALQTPGPLTLVANSWSAQEQQNGYALAFLRQSNRLPMVLRLLAWRQRQDPLAHQAVSSWRRPKTSLPSLML